MVYAYIRVSTDKQTVENQRYEIETFCRQQSLSIDDWFEETISGTIPWESRSLGRLVHEMSPKDLLICTELSRVGRSLFMILDMLNHCLSRGIRVWTIKDGYRLGDDITSKVLAFAFGLSAEIERNLISSRTREALARRRAKGLPLGRPIGAQPTSKIHAHKTLILQLLERKVPIQVIAKRLCVHRQTVLRYLRANAIEYPQKHA